MAQTADTGPGEGELVQESWEPILGEGTEKWHLGAGDAAV